MSWSIPIGAVKGTVIRIHLTFLLFLVWIGFTHYVQGGTGAAVQGVAFISLLFLCVLLHEFGHVFAARRYGVFTPDITLLPIGGVARLESIPEQPSQELAIALAGPAVNLVIAAALWLVLGGIPATSGLQPQDANAGLLERLATANLFLVLFNLVPAFPMDGGRVLRALLAYLDEGEKADVLHLSVSTARPCRLGGARSVRLHVGARGWITGSGR